MTDKANKEGKLELLSHLKAAGDSMRLEILRVLRSGSFGVTELAFVFDVTQPRMSHHLKILAEACLVETKKEGNYIFYRRLVPSFSQGGFLSSLFQQIDLIPLGTSLAAKLKSVYEARAKSSLEFFEKHAKQFQDKQKRIAKLEQYKAPLMELFGHLTCQKNLALEVGPGEGRLLGLLSSSFDRVVALDNSAKMLDKARQRAQEEGLKNIRFERADLGDKEVFGGLKGRVDLAVFDMVMHHQASPRDVFRDIYEVLDERGCFLLVELCPHHQNWVRESLGDIWLGFEPEDLTGFARGCGFKNGPKIFQSLKNGFQIQLRLFFK